MKYIIIIGILTILFTLIKHFLGVDSALITLGVLILLELVEINTKTK